MDKNNVVPVLIEQHNVLKLELGAIGDILKDENPNLIAVFDKLQQFAKDLTEHLKLENDVFYVALIKKMKEVGDDTTKTEQFINEVKDIEKKVHAFLGKFHDINSIRKEPDVFKKEFSRTAENLALRIEAEEGGVFTYNLN